MAAAMQWVSRITTVSLTMVLPAVGGHLLDLRLKTNPWLLIAGALFGMLAGFSQLLKIAGSLNPPNRTGSTKDKG